MKFHSSVTCEYEEGYDKEKYREVSFDGDAFYIYPKDIDLLSDEQIIKRWLDLSMFSMKSSIEEIWVPIERMQYADKQYDQYSSERIVVIQLLLDHKTITNVWSYIENQFNSLTQYKLEHWYDQLVAYVNQFRDIDEKSQIKLNDLNILDLNSVTEKKTLFLNFLYKDLISIERIEHSILTISIHNLSDIKGKIWKLYFKSWHLVFNSSRVIMWEWKQKNLLKWVLDSNLSIVDLDEYMEAEYWKKWYDNESKCLKSLKAMINKINTDKLKRILYPKRLSKDWNQICLK